MTVPGPTRFGAFIAPYHDPAGNPTLQLRRDLELIELLDRLGYDEAWIGVTTPQQPQGPTTTRTAELTGVNQRCTLRITTV